MGQSRAQGGSAASHIDFQPNLFSAPRFPSSFTGTRCFCFWIFGVLWQQSLASYYGVTFWEGSYILVFLLYPITSHLICLRKMLVFFSSVTLLPVGFYHYYFNIIFVNFWEWRGKYVPQISCFAYFAVFNIDFHRQMPSISIHIALFDLI